MEENQSYLATEKVGRLMGQICCVLYDFAAGLHIV